MSGRRWGWVAVAFYLVHAGRHVAFGHAADALWACHLGALAVGVGWLARAPRVNAVGCLWLAMGDVLWGIDLANGGELIPTSLLTHAGGLAIGIAGVVRMGLPRLSWLWAVAAFLGLQLACRIATPPELNVNLSHAVQTGWEQRFPSYVAYEAMLLAIGAASFWAVERASERWLGGARRAR